MKHAILILAASMALGLSSCKDSEEPVAANEHAPVQNSITVTGQSARSVLTLGFLMANHTELPAGSRATDYGYEYDDDDGVFMTEEEAAAFLAPYTQMGRDLRDALIRSYFPATSRSGEIPGGDGGGGTIPGGDNGGAEPWKDPLIGVLGPEDQEAVEMLYTMTDEEVTQVALILSTMAFDDQILEVNGCEITTKHTVDCMLNAFLGVGLDVFDALYKTTGTNFGKRLIIKMGKKQLIKMIGSVVSRFIPGIGVLQLAQNIYDLTQCMTNSNMHKIPDNEYKQLLDEYKWLAEFETVEFEITLD